MSTPSPERVVPVLPGYDVEAGARWYADTFRLKVGVRDGGASILQEIESRPWGTREGFGEDPFGTHLVLRERDISR